MKVAVCVKQVIDSEAVVRVDDAGCVSREGQVLVMDPYSEFALEAAVRLKESCGAQVAAFCIGTEAAQEVLRHALAMGADEAVLIDDAQWEAAEPEVRAAVLASVLAPYEPDIVLGGHQSSDTAHSQVLARIAQQLGYQFQNLVIGLEVEGDQLRIVRELDDGSASVRVKTPVVLGAQQGLAEPRYPNIRAVMAAKRAPLDLRTRADVGVDPAAFTAVSHTNKVKPVRSTGSCTMASALGGVPQLVSAIDAAIGLA